MNQRTLLFGLVLLAAASPASAYLADNYEFNDGLASWTQQAGAWTQQTGDGRFDDTSAEIVASGAGSSSIHQCVDLADLDPGAGVYAFGFGKTVDHANPMLMSLELFETSDCTGSAVATQQLQASFPVAGEWTFLYTVGTVPAAAARSARLWATAFASDAGDTTRIDSWALVPNLHFNAGFDDGLGTWTVNAGDWTFASDDGFASANGAAEVEITDPDCGAGNACAFISQCLDLLSAPRTPYYFPGVAFKALDAVEDLVVSYFYYPETACGGPVLEQTGIGATPSPVGTWRLYTGFEVPPRDARSFAVFVGINDGTVGQRFRVDSIFYSLPVSNPIFGDGFESGDTSAW